MTNRELIEAAGKMLYSQKIDDFYIADVGCALIADNDEVFTGACIGGYLGVCAEQSAASQMVSQGQTKIKKIVAVWKDEQGTLFILPPCGRCREFLRQLSQDNLEADVILGKDHVTKLKDLLPHHGWHAEQAF